jgi:hypothetical protein
MWISWSFPVSAYFVIFTLLTVLAAGWMTSSPNVIDPFCLVRWIRRLVWVNASFARLQPMECLAASRAAPPLLLKQQRNLRPHRFTR